MLETQALSACGKLFLFFLKEGLVFLPKRAIIEIVELQKPLNNINNNKTHKEKNMSKLHYKLPTGAKANYKQLELGPLVGQQKSFYGKAIVEQYDNGDALLYSYGTPVAFKTGFGVWFRLWRGWSATTSKHIKAFIGRPISKQEWERMSVNALRYDSAHGFTGWGIFSN